MSMITFAYTDEYGRGMKVAELPLSNVAYAEEVHLVGADKPVRYLDIHTVTGQTFRTRETSLSSCIVKPEVSLFSLHNPESGEIYLVPFSEIAFVYIGAPQNPEGEYDKEIAYFTLKNGISGLTYSDNTFGSLPYELEARGVRIVDSFA